MNKKVLVILASAFVLFGLYLTSYSENNIEEETLSENSVAIVDQLSIYKPNSTLVNNITVILEQSGFVVYYYPGESVTVDLFRNLPKKGYKIIILRMHSALGPNGEKPVVLFTSEEYNKYSYFLDHLFKRFKKVHLKQENKFFFGITPEFIRHTDGRFNNTIIILMGCNGLTYPDMAQAFIEKGASVFISWDRSVLPTHNDKAILHFLRHFITEKKTLEDSINMTLKEVGYDPEHLSKLEHYPPEKGHFTVDELIG